MEQVSLNYDEKLLFRVVRSFWWRTIGVKFVVAMSLMAVSLCFQIYNSHFGWLAGLVGAGLLMGLLFSTLLYVAHHRNVLGKFRAMQGAPATLKVDINEFEVESKLGSSRMKWELVTEIWKFDDYWLLFLLKAQFITLPTQCLSKSIMKTISEKTAAI